MRLLEKQWLSPLNLCKKLLLLQKCKPQKLLLLPAPLLKSKAAPHVPMALLLFTAIKHLQPLL